MVKVDQCRPAATIGMFGTERESGAGHDIGAEDRGAGREEPRPAARRGRAADARRRLRRSHFPPGRARRPALKPQLVHYYFRTMEELFLEVFRRRAEEGTARCKRGAESPQPLWALWRFGTDPAVTGISMEFMALANHRKELRAEIAYYAERFREQQRQARDDRVGAVRRKSRRKLEMPPVVWSVLMSSVSRVLMLGQAVGVSGGHAETMEWSRVTCAAGR